MVEPMAALAADSLAWRPSSLSKSAGECVETAPIPGCGVAIRDSKDPDDGTLTCTHAEWTAFVRAARRGAFRRSAG